MRDEMQNGCLPHPLQVKDIQAKSAALLSSLERSVVLAVSAIEGKLEVAKYEKEERALAEERKRLVNTIGDILRSL